MTGNRPLRIAYLCDFSPFNRNMYSGGNTRIHDALRTHVGEVTILSQSWHLAEPLRRLMHRTPDAINMRARWRLHLALAGVIARGVRRELAQGRYDVLFCPYAIHAMYRVRPPYPMLRVFSSDATQTTYRNSEVGQWYKSAIRASRMLDPLIERAERAVLRNTDLQLWPSEWLKRLADTTYGLGDATSRVVPWGANLTGAMPRPTRTPLSRGAPLHLILIGRNWWSKGGPMAVDTMKALRARGVDARLTVIGCQPPDFHLGAHVTVHRALDKSDPDQMAVFASVLAAAHFMVMPSYESYGFAYCEASAYGVPSLCLRVGGIPVRDGINGHALPPASGVADFADCIERYLDDPAAYDALCRTSRTEFETHLNWDAWGRRTATLIDEARARTGLTGGRAA